jgi:hypothetical protein
VVGSAAVGGVVAAAVAWLVGVAVPWLFLPNGVFPYVVSELVTSDVATVAIGSTVLALPVAVLVGVPVLFAAFRWSRQPICFASVAGVVIGPALLGALYVLTGSLPHDNTAALLAVAIFGLLGAFSSAYLLSRLVNTSGLRSAASQETPSK